MPGGRRCGCLVDYSNLTTYYNVEQSPNHRPNVYNIYQLNKNTHK